MPSLADLLLIAVVSEAYKGELVSHKCLWYWEGLLFTPILLDVIEVTGVDVTAQFRHDWGGRCTLHQKKRSDRDTKEGKDEHHYNMEYRDLHTYDQKI